MALDLEQETFVVHIITLFKSIKVYPDREVQIAALTIDKTLISIPAKYLNFENVFSKKYIVLLPKYIEINIHAIDLEKGKQLSYRSIYNLGSVELKTLEIYIETNLANGFIYPLNSPTSAPILFGKKPHGSFRLCVDYWGLNNITINHQYLLLLVSKSLYYLSRAKQFTQLDLYW